MRNGMVLHWPQRLLTIDDLHRHLNGHAELALSNETIVTPLAMDEIRSRCVSLSRILSSNGEESSIQGTCGIAQDQDYPLVNAAVYSLQRNGTRIKRWPQPKSSECQWAQEIAQSLINECGKAIVFCQNPGLICCIANKIAGVRCASVCTTSQAAKASISLGANLLVVEMPGRTYFEIRLMIQQICETKQQCPTDVMRAIEELEGNANR